MPQRRDFLRSCLGIAAAGAAAVPVQAQSTVLEGIDVSHWQGAVNWSSVAAAGIRFAFCKATEHTSFLDGQFANNWAGMKNNNIVRGAYHFGRPSYDPIKQARFFYNAVKPTSGDLPLVLDLEATDGLAANAVRLWTQKFCQEVRRLMGRPPIIYTGYYFWQDNVGNSPHNYDTMLWMPRWGVSSPLPLPVAWSTWTFWQYTATGTVAGINPVDRDQFNGNLSALQNIAMP